MYLKHKHIVCLVKVTKRWRKKKKVNKDEKFQSTCPLCLIFPPDSKTGSNISLQHKNYQQRKDEPLKPSIAIIWAKFKTHLKQLKEAFCLNKLDGNLLLPLRRFKFLILLGIRAPPAITLDNPLQSHYKPSRRWSVHISTQIHPDVRILILFPKMYTRCFRKDDPSSFFTEVCFFISFKRVAAYLMTYIAICLKRKTRSCQKHFAKLGFFRLQIALTARDETLYPCSAYWDEMAKGGWWLERGRDPPFYFACLIGDPGFKFVRVYILEGSEKDFFASVYLLETSFFLRKEFFLS